MPLKEAEELPKVRLPDDSSRGKLFSSSWEITLRAGYLSEMADPSAPAAQLITVSRH